MTGFLLRRIATAVAMLWVVGTIIFSMLMIVPGDPAELLLTSGGGAVSEEAIANLRTKMGLDRPVLEQYATFLFHAAQLDFGASIVDSTSIGETIATRLPRTLELIIGAALLALAIGIPAGTYAGLHDRGRFDTVASGINAVLTSVPGFVIGTVLIYVFAQSLGLLPAGGYVPFAQSPIGHLKVLILPTVTVALHLLTVIFRMTRASVLEMRAHDWVRTARAKGLARKLVVRRHILRNALGPVVTVVGLQLGVMLGSTVLVEFVYNWPGLSGFLVSAVEQRDYPTVRGVILVVAALFILINLAIEIIYSILDPRVRLK